MKLPDEIESKLSTLFKLCEINKVRKLYIFGSATKGNFKPESSDLDFIIDLENIDPVEKGETLMRFWTEIENLFGRKVDLLTEKMLKNPYLINEIEKSKFLLYDKAS